MIRPVQLFWAVAIVSGVYFLFLQTETIQATTYEVLRPLKTHIDVDAPLYSYPSPSEALIDEQSPSGNPELSVSTTEESPTEWPLKEPSKMIVVAHLASEDTTWAIDEVPGWHSAIYSVDNTSYPQHLPNDRTSPFSLLSAPRNKGHEAGVYLYHIITHYESLSDITVFLHAHRDGYPRAWHTDNEQYSNPLSVQRLRTAYVEKEGFTSMRCNTNPGCPAETQLFRDPPEPHRRHELAMPAALKEMFGWERHELPEVLAAACCSQFAVSRAQVHRRTKAEYERYYQWLLKTELDDAVSGRILEYLWHVIFGKPPVWCPELTQCYCDLYGTYCPYE